MSVWSTKMKHPKPKPTTAYADMLTEKEPYPSLVPSVSAPETISKKKIVTKKKLEEPHVPPLKTDVPCKVGGINAYNTFIKTKREELIAMYPHLSKSQTLEMAREAYKLQSQHT